MRSRVKQGEFEPRPVPLPSRPGSPWPHEGLSLQCLHAFRVRDHLARPAAEQPSPVTPQHSCASQESR